MGGKKSSGKARRPSIFETFFHENVDAFAIVGPDFQFEEVNPSGAALLGVEREALIGRSFFDFLDPDDIQENPIRFDEIASERLRFGERVLVRADGSRTRAELTVKQVAPGRILVSARDLGPRLEVQSRMRALIEASPDVHLLLDDELRYIEILTGREDLLAAPADAMLGRLVSEFLPPETTQQVADAVQRALETRVPQQLEYRLDVPAGERWFEARIVAAHYTREGRPLVMLSTRDVTDVRRRTLLLEAAQSDARLGAFEVDAETRSLTWTDELYRIHGVSPESFRPDLESALSFYDPTTRERLSRYLERLLEREDSLDELVTLETEHRTKHLRVVARSSGLGGRVTRIEGSVQDVTDLRTRLGADG